MSTDTGTVGTVLRVLLYGTGIVAVGVCLLFGLWQFLGLTLATAWRAFEPRGLGAPEQRVVPYAGAEPARRAYWAWQMWHDSRHAVLFASRTVRYLLVRHWLGTVVRDRLLRGRSGRSGARPDASLAGRRRLTAHCPHCDQPLPPAVGTTRVVHLPLIGGTSAGKTMLMAAVLEGLRSWSHQSSLKVEFASPDDLREANALGRQLKDSGWTLKTQGGQPRALMLLVGWGLRRRLLYLYDPMGESLRDADNTRLQGYLAHADGVLFVADVLASPVVRRKLGAGDPKLTADARPADLGPVETYAALAGELQGLSGRRGRLAVAAVVTKRDTLDRLTSLPRPAEPVDAWLDDIGLDDLVRSFRNDFAAARYWAVSARAATGAGALDSEHAQPRGEERPLSLARPGLADAVRRVRLPAPVRQCLAGEGAGELGAQQHARGTADVRRREAAAVREHVRRRRADAPGLRGPAARRRRADAGRRERAGKRTARAEGSRSGRRDGVAVHPGGMAAGCGPTGRR